MTLQLSETAQSDALRQALAGGSRDVKEYLEYLIAQSNGADNDLQVSADELRSSLAKITPGSGRTLEEFDAELCQEYGLSPWKRA